MVLLEGLGGSVNIKVSAEGRCNVESELAMLGMQSRQSDDMLQGFVFTDVGWAEAIVVMNGPLF